MKRILFLVVFAMATLGVIFAAGGSETGSTGGSAANLMPPGQLPLVKDTVTLKYTMREGVQSITAVASNDLAVIQEYEKRTNVHIEWEVIPGSSYNEVITARMNAGVNLPDMIQVPGGIAEKMARDGIIVPITEMVNGLAPNMGKHWAKIPIEKIKLQYPDGNIYYLSGHVLPDMLMPGVLIAKPWLEKLGEKMPQTTDEYYRLLLKFRDEDPNGNGEKDEIPLSCSNGNLNHLASSFGLQLMFNYNFQADANGKVSSDFVSPRYKDFLAYISKLYEEGLLTKDFLTYRTQTAFEHIGKDVAGSLLFWHTWGPRYSSLHEDGDPDGLTPVFIPSIPLEGPYGDQYKLKRILSSSGGFGVTSACENPEVAVKWFDYIVYHPEAQYLYIYGLEGTTFKWEGDKRVRLQPTDPKKTWEQLLVDIGGRQPNHPHQQTEEGRRAIFAEWIFPYDASFKKYYKDPFVAGLMAFTNEEKDEWNQYNTDIMTFVNESRAKFMTGQEPLDNFDDYVATLKKLGIDTMTQIRQQQYDRFLDFSN